MNVTIDRLGRIAVRKQGVLIHHGPETVSLDMAEFVNRDRANRDTDLVAEGPAE